MTSYIVFARVTGLIAFVIVRKQRAEERELAEARKHKTEMLLLASDNSDKPNGIGLFGHAPDCQYCHCGYSRARAAAAEYESNARLRLIGLGWTPPEGE